MKTDKTDEPNKKIDELNAEVEEEKNKYLRALADYQNLEKQTRIWKEEFVTYANLGLIVKLLDVLDNLSAAQEHLKDDGLELVINKFKSILANEGLVEVELTGKEYDANEAEVVSTEAGDENNIVVKVLQKGYKLRDKIIKPAKVIVSVKQ